MECKLTWLSQEALSNMQDPPKLAQNSAKRPKSWKGLSSSDYCHLSQDFGTCSAWAGSAPCCKSQGMRNSAWLSFPRTPQCKNAVHSFMQVSIELNFYFLLLLLKGSAMHCTMGSGCQKMWRNSGTLLTSSWWDWKAALNLASWKSPNQREEKAQRSLRRSYEDVLLCWS